MDCEHERTKLRRREVAGGIVHYAEQGLRKTIRDDVLVALRGDE